MKTDDMVNSIKRWINFKILPNVSGQDQVNDHIWPHLAVTLFLLTIPVIGIYISLLVPAFSFYKELVEDSHWRDLFGKSESAKDGRIDLFFRLAGSGFGYLTLLWR